MRITVTVEDLATVQIWLATRKLLYALARPPMNGPVHVPALHQSWCICYTMPRYLWSVSLLWSAMSSTCTCSYQNTVVNSPHHIGLQQSTGVYLRQQNTEIRRTVSSIRRSTMNVERRILTVGHPDSSRPTYSRSLGVSVKKSRPCIIGVLLAS